MWYYYLVHYLPPALFLGPVALWIFVRVRSERRWGWVMRPLSIAALGLAATLLAATFPTAASDGWCASRLSVPIAWVLGDDLYHLHGEGPALVRMYGPVYSMVYAATALAWRPTVALLLGAAINLSLFAGFTAWVLRRSGREASNVARYGVAATFALAAALGCPLLDIAGLVTVDAPALAFAAGACAVLIGHQSSDTITMRTAIVCGLFAAASIWTKQTMAPLVFALAIYLLLVAPPRIVVTMLLCVALVSALLLMLFGPDRMLYHMLVIPSLHPTNWPWLGRRGAMLRGLWFAWWESKIVAWMALAALLLLRDVPARHRLSDVRAWALRSPWLLTLLVALLVLPTTMLAYVKLAGNRNNVAPLCYFGLLTATTAALGLCRKPADRDAPLPPRQRLALMGISGLLIVLPWAQRNEMLRALPGLRAWTDFAHTDQEQAFAYLRQHPRQAYFPQFPLVSLLADRKPYHFDEAIKDFDRAGVRLTPQQLRAGLPDQMREILFIRRVTDPIPSLLPEYDQRSTPDELPGWIRLTRSPSP